MLKNIYFYRKNFHCLVKGFTVPKEFIADCTLNDIERILGFRRERLKKGAAFAQLDSLPEPDDLEYLGSSETPEHRWNEKRDNLSKRGVNITGSKKLNRAAYHYLQPGTRLIKVIPLSNPNPLLSEDENWPSGIGAMQYKLKKEKPAMVVEVIEDYPNGRFR